MNKRLILILTVVALCMSTIGCSKTANNTSSSSAAIETSQNDTDTNDEIEHIDATIVLGDNISVEGNGVTVSDNKVTITSSGTYSINGTLSDGQIIVNTEDQENVYLLLNGANITCSNSSPIYVMNAKNAIIVLADGTDNSITDGTSYILEDAESDEPNAAIFSKDDLTIKGSGSLTVNGNYNNGITSKDDLKITGGNITVTSIADGLRGRDSITIKGGNITVNAKGDGIKSNNDEDIEKGYILIEDGTLNITAGEDGIQAETKATISGGNITISSGGGSVNSSTNTNDKAMNPWGNWGGGTISNKDKESSSSAKGIKAPSSIVIEGGIINIDSSDDSIHSNDSIVIKGGTIDLASGDDGIHSDSTLEINGGDINITKSYEGIESTKITISNGNISVVASDDGLNAAGGNDGSSTNGRIGQNNFMSSSNGSININGGNLVIDATGDGIDSNGSIKMTAGTVIVNGPTNNGNGALDYDSTFDITGGFFVAVGSAGMAQSPSTSSSQNSINLTVASQEAKTLIHIESESGDNILTFAPSKSYESIVVSSPEIKNNTNYIAYLGGSSNGTPKNGLYTDGTYTPGNKTISFTTSGTVTNAAQEGVSSGRNNGGFGENGPMGENPGFIGGNKGTRP